MERMSLLPAALGAVPVLLDVIVKGFVLVSAAGILGLALRRASAASRHLLWLVTTLGLLGLPLLSVTVPGWQAPMAPGLVFVPTTRAEALLATDAASSRERQSSKATALFAPQRSRTSASPDVLPAAPAPITPAAPRWQGWVLGVWLAGAAIVLAQMLAGLALTRRIRRRCRQAAMSPLAHAVTEARAALDVKRPVSVLTGVSDAVPAVPMTMGCFRPVVVLPASVPAWPRERLRVVLLHEMAHIKRADWLAQMLAHTACAFYWCNPLVWLLARRLRAESEQACDDLVLLTGVKASDYARHLLEIVQGLCRQRRFTGAALTIARRHEIPGRLRAILAEGASRQRITPRTLAAAALAMAGVLVPLATVRPAATARAAGSPGQNHDACQSNLKRLGLAFSMYAQDYDDMLPLMNTAPQMQNRLRPYIAGLRKREGQTGGTQAAFSCPETQLPYQPNAALSHKELRVGNPPRRIRNAEVITLARDAAAHRTPGGSAEWNVVYADGHVAAVPTPDDTAGVVGNPDLQRKVRRFHATSRPRAGDVKAPYSLYRATSASARRIGPNHTGYTDIVISRVANVQGNYDMIRAAKAAARSGGRWALQDVRIQRYTKENKLLSQMRAERATLELRGVVIQVRSKHLP